MIVRANVGSLRLVLATSNRPDSGARPDHAHGVDCSAGTVHILPNTRTCCATCIATVTGVHANGHLRAALRRPDFRRLYSVRLLGQFGDGVFQASLAGAVLFNPEHQAHAADVAAGFAVVLLPYSLIGPFAGVLLDRWWRQRVLTLANLVRAVAVIGVAAEVAAGLAGVAFYASALVIISISRFVLSALSAALPRVVAEAELVTANAVSA